MGHLSIAKLHDRKSEVHKVGCQRLPATIQVSWNTMVLQQHPSPTNSKLLLQGSSEGELSRFQGQYSNHTGGLLQ